MSYRPSSSTNALHATNIDKYILALRDLKYNMTFIISPDKAIFVDSAGNEYAEQEINDQIKNIHPDKRDRNRYGEPKDSRSNYY